MDYNLGELKFNLWFLRKIMESNILLGFVVLLLLLKIVLIGFSVNLPFNVFFADITKITLENLANQTRQSLGLGILASSLKLDQAARLKAEDMVKNQYFSHTSPTGVTPWFWFSQTDYNYKYAGENLAIGFFDSEEVYRAWLDSPSHKANLVNPNYREIGTAIASGFGQNKAVVVVQFFGSLKPAAASERVLSQSAETEIQPISYLISNSSPLMEDVVFGMSFLVIVMIILMIYFSLDAGIGTKLVFRSVLILVLLGISSIINKELLLLIIPHQLQI